MQRDLPTRRQALTALGAVAATASASAPQAAADEAKKKNEDSSAAAPGQAKGNIKQSVCRWCYGRVPLEKLALAAKKIGYHSVELLLPTEYRAVKDAGLTCAVIGRPSIDKGLNRKEHHDRIVKELTGWIEFAAEEKLPNVICMSGNRAKLGDDEGLKTCAVGLKRVVGLAEKKKVTLIMEGLNSKIDHKDYMYDRTRWGVDLCKKVGSERFKLLYDIYHMQIMEGDVIRTLREASAHIGHYHTGGVPDRNEIDDTQELNYPAIVKAIVATGYRGYLGQEFLPKRDAMTSLAAAFRLCDV